MSTESAYRRTKDKYIVEAEDWHADRFREMFDSFGTGTYWHVRDDGKAQKDYHVSYEVWLTPEELTALKIVIPTMWHIKVR